jgi:hypothetical protein
MSMDTQTFATDKNESDEACTEQSEVAASVIEEFELDDVEVVESKVFA